VAFTALKISPGPEETMRANGTSQHSHKDLVKEINALKIQLKKLSSALETEANDGVSRAMGAIETKSKEAIDDAIAAAQGFIDDYADTARDAAAALGKKSAQMREAATDSLVEAVETRPLTTLAALLGLGFLAGYLCRRT
jgi:ABC-type transporter Mla subunit MlaD